MKAGYLKSSQGNVKIAMTPWVHSQDTQGSAVDVSPRTISTINHLDCLTPTGDSTLLEVVVKGCAAGKGFETWAVSFRTLLHGADIVVLKVGHTSGVRENKFY